MNYTQMSFPGKIISHAKKIYFKRMHGFHILMLVLSILLIYQPAADFKFLIGWDDQWFVTNYYTENGFSRHNMYAIFTEYYYGQYAPLNQLYYIVLYKLFKYNPAAFHISGILLHLVNTILVYLLLNTISTKLIYRPAIQIRQISFLAALLFAVLPINIEPVAWVSASKVTIYALFYLISLICYCKYLEAFNTKYYYLTLIFFVISFGAKEQAILLPFCLLLFDFVYNRNIKDKIIWLEKLPFFILMTLFGMVTLSSQALENGERTFYPFYQRLPLVFYTFSEYFTKCLLPIHLSYIYPFPFQESEKVPWWLWIYPLTIPAVIYCLYDQIKVKWIFFSLMFFSIHIILVLNFFTLGRFSVIADRYVYLSTIGICFLISTAFVNHIYKKYSAVILLIGILYLGALITYSRIHVATWASVITLKTKLIRTIEERPDFKHLQKLK